jgi:hypothetical protein
MSELIEHKLNQLNHQPVDVVRPGYGTQSESFVGYLTVFGDHYPLQFQVQHSGGALLFTVDDVVRIDPPKNPTDERNQQPIIRLKGPQDYRSHLVSA